MTAIKEPKCKLTSIDRLFSSSRKLAATIKCEEELTGKNSAIP